MINNLENLIYRSGPGPYVLRYVYIQCIIENVLSQDADVVRTLSAKYNILYKFRKTDF